MNNRDLEKLYEATSEDLLFALGLLVVPGSEPAPYIHIHYRGWSREKLDVVREAFAGGLVLTVGDESPGETDVYIATRELISLQGRENGCTSVLRAPAWDARLENVDAAAVRLFESNRKGFGGFLLLLQTPEWESQTAVRNGNGGATVGPVEERSSPMPAGNGR